MEVIAKLGKDQQMSGMSAFEPTCKLHGTEMEVIGTDMEVIAKLGKDQQMSGMSTFEPKLHGTEIYTLCSPTISATHNSFA